MSKNLQSFKVIACKFYNIPDQAFLWNSIPPDIGTIQLSESVIDDDSKHNATWTSNTSFKDIDESINLSTKSDDLEFIPTWHKPKLKDFVLRDFGTFRNDPDTFNVNQFLLHSPIIAPSLEKIHLNYLDLNGLVHIERLRKALNLNSKSPKVQISLFKSGLDMIGCGLISCGIKRAPESIIEKAYAVKEMHVFDNFERFFKCQQNMLEKIDHLSPEYRVDHQLLSYDDVMEVYDFYQAGLKSNVPMSGVDVQTNNSFHSIVNIQHQYQHANDSIQWVISRHRFVRHCGVPTVSSPKTEEAHSSLAGGVIFCVCLLILAIVAVAGIAYSIANE